VLTSALLPINFFWNWMVCLTFERVAGGISQIASIVFRAS